MLVYLALAGAIASSSRARSSARVAGAEAGSHRPGRSRGRIRRRRRPAASVNKALVAFIACMLVGVAAFSARPSSFREVESDMPYES